MNHSAVFFIQLITADNGIIEMGCEVKYRISDVQRLTTSVTSPEHGLRSFGKTVLLNVLTKNTVRYDLHSSLDLHRKKEM